MRTLLLLLVLGVPARAAPAPAPRVIPGNRVASVLLSQDFLNEQLARHVKSELLRDLRLDLDPARGRVVLRGALDVPTEELRAVNLDPELRSFKFQVTIEPHTTRQGHLILVFPLDETLFWPASSSDPDHDRVVVPVQLLSVALASARGYFAALSGDFSGFDRRAQRLKAKIAGLDAALAAEKDAETRDDLKTERKALELQLETVPLERKQLLAAGKEVRNLLGFTGEKEMNLNEELAARRNALALRLHQALFESAEVVAAEDKDMGPKLKDFSLQLEEDGVHISGKWKTPLLFSVPFETILDLVWVAPNVFELRVRELELADVDFKALTKLVLEAARKRLESALKDRCRYEYVGEEGDRSRAVRVTVDMPKLLPAFPELSLVGVDTSAEQLVLKAGRP